jgi:hypothetical protein
MAQVQQYLEPQVREDYAQVSPVGMGGWWLGGVGSESGNGVAADAGFEYCWECMRNDSCIGLIGVVDSEGCPST